ncbi:hypothetical protein VNO80_01695 [Phaseolus coccineus]|uniref:Uncharacterized protein n=1 Tax=Phaseolus coccineus TaxID=3886 RepID=A0AAN9RT20_PHACN
MPSSSDNSYVLAALGGVGKGTKSFADSMEILVDDVLDDIVSLHMGSVSDTCWEEFSTRVRVSLVATSIRVVVVVRTLPTTDPKKKTKEKEGSSPVGGIRIDLFWPVH